MAALVVVIALLAVQPVLANAQNDPEPFVASATDVVAEPQADVAALSGRVFTDANSNGTRDVGEPGIPHLAIYARRSGVVAASTTSAADGSYAFADLPPAEYQVQFTGLLGREFTVQDQGVSDLLDSDVDPTTGLTSVIVLGTGESIGSVDAGLLPPEPPSGAISGVVFTDENEDGVRQPDEQLERWVMLWLRDGDGERVGTHELTDELGQYEFAGLAPGAYSVELPTEILGNRLQLGFSEKDQGDDDSIDNDFDPATGVTDLYVVDDNVVAHVDAGLLAWRTIKGRLFFDADGDGIQDPGEGFFPGFVEGYATARDDAGNLIDTARIEDQYYYLDVPTGEYRVDFNVYEEGTEITVQNAGNDDTIDSDVDPVTSVSDVVSVGPNQRSATVDIGIRPILNSGTISGRVWLDANRNGLEDFGEPGLGDATVSLYNADADVTSQRVTQEDGLYRFRDLPSGEYRVEYGLPPGFEFTIANVGDNDSIDSDPINGVVEGLQIVPGQVAIVDAGAIRVGPLLTVGGVVFLDANENGLQDAGEVGEAGVNVALFAAGKPQAVGVDATDASGRYEIAAPDAGEYQLSFNLRVSDLVATKQDVGDDDAIDSDIDATGRTPSFMITTEDPAITTLDAGVFRPSAAIRGRVFFDENENGLEDAGEDGVEGNVIEGSVKVIDASGAVVRSARPSASGAWEVASLRSGEYRVEFDEGRARQFTQQDQGDDDSIDSDADPQTGLTAVYTLVPGQTIDDVDAGVIPQSGLGSIGGVVFFDDDNDGIRNPDYLGVSGAASVAVFDTDDTWIDFADIGFDGAWVVSGLPAGDYYARFSLDGGLEFSPRDQGTDDSIDSDALAFVGKTAVYSLGPGEDLLGVDAGVRVDASMTASIGNFVFEDLDEDGWQDSVEPGFPGVTIEVVHGSGRVVAVTASDSTGAYLASDLLPGEYTIRVALPQGRNFTGNRPGPLNSVVDPATGSSSLFTLDPGDVVTTLDVGVLPIDDDVLGDVNCDGVSNIVDALFIVYYETETHSGVNSCSEFRDGDDVTAIQNGDVNGDGDVNIVDAMVIAACEAALNNVFCPAPE